MKKYIIFFLLIYGIGAWVAAQDKQLSALFNFNAFYNNEAQRPYVETYLSFDAWSMNFVRSDDGKYRATAEIVLLARQGDSVVYVKKYDLNSPAIDDTTQTDFNFLDLQRFYLNNGLYSLELSVRDKASQQEAVVVRQPVSIYFGKKEPVMSRPQLMATAKKTVTQNVLSRSGYDMEPYLSDFVPEEITQLNIYYEIYNINREVGGKPFLTYAFIEDQATGRRAGNTQHVARHQSAGLVPVFTVLDIKQLPSGSYNLVVEVHDKDNEKLLYQKLPFYRSNPQINMRDSLAPVVGTFAADITDENQLNYFLDALYPIASDAERAAIKDMIRRPALEEKQVFFYNFWLSRHELQAKERWEEYRGWLAYVDQAYSFPNTPGYRTDRGRVYLQYGPPDYIRDEKNFVSALKLGAGTQNDMRREDGTITAINPAGGHYVESQGHIYYLPYQLWRYNKLDKDDANRVFLFWDEFRNGFYKLLVSNARGEVTDPLWERRLSQQQLGEYVVGEVGEQFNRGH
ncbi:MAG: GWxTD domain-containing protein [Bacteroidales bacterium]|nr:GWxTD domain-containing protein [Bacteroidales bacterium]